MTGRVFQLVPVLEPGDAIGTHAQRMAEILGEQSGGFIVQKVAPELEHLATHWSKAEVSPDDILIYHVALASELGNWMRGIEARKVIDYHNITPPEFFRAYEPGLSVALAGSHYELELLRPEVLLAISDSDYSRLELEAMGFARTETLPIFIDYAQYEVEPNQHLMEELTRGKSERGDILFVGRIAPNKRHEDLIKAFVTYRRAFRPSARLFLVGGTNSLNYSRVLEKFVQRLGVEGVNFVGRVPTEDLVAYYRSADVFLSMSEHEGFGAPWVEAMYFGLPIVSFAAAAISETVGEAGVLFREKNYEDVAALIDVVMQDEEVRNRLAAAGRARFEYFRPEVFEARFRSMIEELP